MSDTNDTPKISRRQLLTRVTLVAGAAYVAPAMMQMESAAAEARSSGGKPPKATRPTRPSRPPQPPKPPAPTRPTRPSRPKPR
jgi:putative endonuclease